MVLAVLLDGDGRPVCTEMWPGNTADVGSLVRVVDSLPIRLSLQPLAVVFGHAHGRSPAWQSSVSHMLQSSSEKARWSDGFVRPHCQAAGELFRFANRPGVLRCRECRRDTGLTVGTVMARSHTPLSDGFGLPIWCPAKHPAVGRPASATTWPVALRDGVPNPPQAPRGDGAPGSGPDRRQARRNLKTWLNGIHHGVSHQHLEAYLNEFTFRFNRRFYPFNAFRSLLGIAGDVTAPTYAELYSGAWQHPDRTGGGTDRDRKVDRLREALSINASASSPIAA